MAPWVMLPLETLGEGLPQGCIGPAEPNACMNHPSPLKQLRAEVSCSYRALLITPERRPTMNSRHSCRKCSRQGAPSAVLFVANKRYRLVAAGLIPKR